MICKYSLVDTTRRKYGCLHIIIETLVEQIPRYLYYYLHNNSEQILPRLIERFDDFSVVSIFRCLLDLPLSDLTDSQLEVKPWWGDNSKFCNALINALKNPKTAVFTSEFLITIIHRGFYDEWVLSISAIKRIISYV